MVCIKAIMVNCAKTMMSWVRSQRDMKIVQGVATGK
jgi:hypothetical protein